MPYRIARLSSCPPDRPFAVVLISDNSILGCHADMAGGERQIAAIEISERTEAEKQQPTSSAVHVDTIMNPKKRKPKYAPSILLKGDYVGHPFRGNQWTDASGLSRGMASGSAPDGDRVDLRGVATVEEARRTGRPLALLQLETYPAGVQAALRARFEAAEIVKNLLEGVPEEEQGAIAHDPRFIIAEYASTLAHYEVIKQIGRDYALALGFTEVTGEEAEKARFEKYTYDHVSRNEDGRLTHGDETVYPTEMTGEQSAMNVRGSIVWRDGSGKLNFWFVGEEQPPEFTKIHGERASSEGIDFRALADPSKINPESYYHRDTDEEGVQRGPKAAAFANQEMQKRIRALGIRMPDLQPFANLSGKALEEKLRADGDPNPKETIGRLIDHVNSVARKAALSHAPIDGYGKYRGQNIDGSEDFEMARQMEDIAPDAKISVTVPANKMSAILKDGRLKTQFETQRSGGANMPTWREDWEAVMFGFPIGSNPSVRPIYGMVETGGVQPSSLRGNEQYGTVTLVLKDSVRDRTTFTNGDSLNLNLFYAPVNDPSFRPTSRVSDVSLSRREEVLQRRAENPRNRGYYEAQIHGGVQVSDIERVVIDTSTYKDFEQREVQPPAALIKALTKAGIPFEIVQGKPPDAPTVGKALFNPFVLIKGDYVGHPFRGNQWADASGVSRGNPSATPAGTPTEQLLTGVREYRIYLDQGDKDRWAPTLFIDGQPTTIQGTVAHLTKEKAEKGLAKFARDTDAMLDAAVKVADTDGGYGPLAELTFKQPDGRVAMKRVGWAEQGRVEALEAYTRDSVALNTALRDGTSTDGPLDPFMESGGQETLYRSIANTNGIAGRLFSELTDGATVVDRGYSSTSRIKRSAVEMDVMGDGLLLQIQMPSGSLRLAVPKGVFFGGDQEEVILPRGSGFRLVRQGESVDGRPTLVVELVEAPETVEKGDYVGHPFRGNQWTDASGITRGTAGSTVDQDRQAYEMRQAGETWETIAQHLGYANGGAVRRLALRHEARLRASGETPPELPPQPAVGTPDEVATATPTGQFFNGLRTPSADLLTAAREGRPLQGWLKLPPHLQVLVNERDRRLELRTEINQEARLSIKQYLESLSPEDRLTEENIRVARLSSNNERISWLSERNPDFKARVSSLDKQPLLGYYEIYNQVVDEMLVAAGFRYRTADEQAQLVRDIKFEYDRGDGDGLAERGERLKADPLRLSWTQYDRNKMGGRLTESSRQEQIDRSTPKNSILGRLSYGPLLKQGLSEQQIGEILMSAKKVAERLMRTEATDGNMIDLTGAELKANQLSAMQMAEDTVKDARVSITVPPRILSQVLGSGRFKSQFESGKSGGYNLPQAREQEESSRFGYPSNLEPSLRPIYGMVETKGIQLPNDRGNLQYGSALVILKPEVRERTTFTFGDSLGNISPSAPLTNPRAVPRVAGVFSQRGELFQDFYAEAQIHGGVKVSDIERVVFQVDSMRMGGRDIPPDPKSVPAPSPSLLRALDKAGIPYQIVGLTSQITQPVTKHRKWLLAFDPSVLIKGDYVGHPFRGNQWTNASGVSTGLDGSASDHQGGFAAGKKYERQRGPFRADPPSVEPFRDESSPTGEYDARSEGNMGRQYETQSKSDEQDRVMSDQKARTVASNLMDKMDIVAASDATIKIGSPSREMRAEYNDQLDSLAETELKTRSSQRLLDGILATQEALNDEGVVVVITDSEDRIAGALSFSDEATDSSRFLSRSSFHPMSEVVKPNEKYIMMASAGSLGRIDGVGSALFAQAVLAASRQGAGLYLTPLNKSAKDFWENVGFRTVDAGQEFLTYQYVDADSVRAIAENLDDPMEQQ